MVEYLRTKLVSAILIILVIGLSLRLFAGDGSFVHVYLLNGEMSELTKLLESQRESNKHLANVTYSLKNDLDMIETIARADMGMIHKDEIFFIEK